MNRFCAFVIVTILNCELPTNYTNGSPSLGKAHWILIATVDIQEQSVNDPMLLV